METPRRNIDSVSKRSILVNGAAILALLAAAAAAMASAPGQPSAVDDAGNLRLPNGTVIPYSNLASVQARNNFVDQTRGYERILAPKPSDWQRRQGETAPEEERRWYDQTLYLPWLAKLRRQFAVSVEPKTIAGVQTDIVDPAGGASDANRHRVLINLHGGGMVVGGRYGGQLESIPIASVGKIRVITVDYRMAPEHKYPAAEQDVIAVYRDLLKTDRPENIGIYGCSAGAELTASTIATLIATGERKPGAIGMFGGGPADSPNLGDSNYIFSGGKARWSEAADGYTGDVNLRDATRYPAGSADIQRRFPPSLLISGTRDAALSRTVFAHSRLVDLGVDAELHVWEGAPHCSFAQPFVDPGVPESQQAWKVIARFFDRHLGREKR
ncbi:MAG: alpha/beta hydrolase [Sphingomonas sp.]|uniref:alpha/beta hydrolase n=1 Tax=Sphingomonas sp. TaxID=28214 RepID=UPI003F8120DF